MARKGKTGLDYYSHDVNMRSDSKIRFIKAKHGFIAYAIFNALLEEIYQNGYFIENSEKYSLLFADENKIELEVFKNVLNDCIEEGLFDKNIYKKYKILTSKRIQINFLVGCDRRKSVDFIKEYLLIDPNVEKNPKSKINVNILRLNVDINQLDVSINSEDDISKDYNANICTQKEKEKEKEKEITEKHHVDINKKNISEKSKQLFKTFWISYRKKTDYASCEKLFFNMPENEQELAVKASELYNRRVEEKYLKQPAKWLDGKCWNEEDLTPEETEDEKVARKAAELKAAEEEYWAGIRNPPGFMRMG